MPYWLLATIFIILILPGLAGVFLPLPSLLYMLAVALLFGFVNKFQHLSGVELGILSAIALISLLTDYFSGVLGAKYGGATKISLLLGILGFFIGTVAFPPFGGIAGIFLGIFLSEVFQGKRWQALKAASGGVIGTLSGMVINLILAIFFLILFIIFVWA